MTNPDREELVKLNEAGLEAAVRECARITAPEITNDEYERIKAENSPRYQNTRAEMARTIRAYLASSDSGVKVRELEWRDHSFKESVLHIAHAAFEDYRITYDDDARWPWVLRPFIAGQSNYQTLDAAKAAAQADYEARIKSALVEVPAAKGEPEPVAWSKARNPPAVGGTYIVGGYIDDGTLPRHFERDFALFRQTDDGPEWSLSGKRNIPIEYWHDIPAHPEHRDAIVTAPPADAGMREAPRWRHKKRGTEYALIGFGKMQSEHWRDPDVDGDYDTQSVDMREVAIYRADSDGTLWVRPREEFEDGRFEALTAPGATTKSDGVRWGDSGPIPGQHFGDEFAAEPSPSDPSSTRSERWVCAARQRGITLDPQDCDWPVCGCDPLANKVLDTITESGFVIVPKDGAPMTDDQIKHMVDRFLDWTLPENFNPDGGVSFKRLENRHHHPDASPFYPMPVGTNLFDATEATAMVRHMLEGLPSTRSDVTVEDCARRCADELVVIVEAATKVVNRTENTFVMDRQKVATMIAGHFAALLDQFEIRRR